MIWEGEYCFPEPTDPGQNVLSTRDLSLGVNTRETLGEKEQRGINEERLKVKRFSRKNTFS